MVHENVPPSAKATGGLAGIGSAGGGLVVGPETLLGKVLILASPMIVLCTDYIVVYARRTIRRWERNEPVRIARKTLKQAIRDPDTPEERRTVYREQLADLHDAVIAATFAALARSPGAYTERDSPGVPAVMPVPPQPPPPQPPPPISAPPQASGDERSTDQSRGRPPST